MSPLFIPLLAAFGTSTLFLTLRLWISPPLGLRISFLALPLGFLTGLLLIPGSFCFPPEEGFQWIFWAGLIGGGWPFLFLNGEPLSLRTCFIRFCSLLVVTYVLLFWFHSSSLFFFSPPHNTEVITSPLLSLTGKWIFASLFLTFFWIFSEKAIPSRLFPSAALWTSLSFCFFALLTGSLKLSQMIGCLASVLGLATLWNSIFTTYPLGLNVVPLVVMTFSSFVLCHKHFLEYPFQTISLMTPFWISGIFFFIGKKWPLWVQSFSLLLFSLPILTSALLYLFKTENF